MVCRQYRSRADWEVRYGDDNPVKPKEHRVGSLGIHAVCRVSLIALISGLYLYFKTHSFYPIGEDTGNRFSSLSLRRLLQ